MLAFSQLLSALANFSISTAYEFRYQKKDFEVLNLCELNIVPGYDRKSVEKTSCRTQSSKSLCC